MLEYVLVFAALLGLTAVLSLFLYAAKAHANRSVELVAADYP